MADVVLVKDGKRFSAPPDKVDAAIAAGFAREEVPTSPAAAPHRRSGSTVSIADVAPPAGEGDSEATVILEKGGKRFSAPMSKVAAAKAAGFAEVGPGAVDTAIDVAQKVGGAVVDAVTGRKRETQETRDLPDFSLMPEMRQALISNTIPALGTLTAQPVVAAESFARNLDKDAPGFGVPAAVENIRANMKTSAGTTLASADEQVRSILANNPKVKARKDNKGNTILTSAQDGREYVVPPGATAFDAPRVAQGAAAFTPAGRLASGGRAALIGLGEASTEAAAPLVRAGVGALTSAGTQAAVEGVQAAGGGDFNPSDVAIAGALGALPGAAGAVKESAARSAADLAAENAARRAAQQAKNAANPPAAPARSAGDVLGNLVDAVEGLDPVKSAALEEFVPGFGRILRVAKAKVKADRAKEAAKTAAAEVDDVVKAVDDEVVAASTAPSVTAADDVAAAVDQTITPTPTAKGRSGPQQVAAPAQDATNANRRRPAAPVEEPTGEVVIEPTQTATAPVRRLPPMTEGLEPTEVLSREVVEQAAPRARPRRLDDDAATMLIRQTAIDNGTRDAAQLSNLTGLPSSQVTRVLPRLTRNAMFRNEVDSVAAAKAPAQAPPAAPPAPPAPTAASLATEAAAPPDADLFDALLRQYKGDAQKARAAYHAIKAKQFAGNAPDLAKGRQRSAVAFDPKSPGPAPIATPKGRNRASAPLQTPSKAPPPAPKPAEAPKQSEPSRILDSREVAALDGKIKDVRKSAAKQLRDLTPDRAFSLGEEAVFAATGDPYANFAGMADKAKTQSAMGAALLDEINGHLGLSGAKRVRTPKEAWIALIRKNPPKRGETMADSIRNRIESLETAARMMRTIPGWESFDIGADLASLQAALKTLSHLENTGVQSLRPLPKAPF